jgi:adenylosuccinate lyase
MTLTSISPIDGRYHDRTKELSEYFSEYALMKKRVFVELKYLVELGKADDKLLRIHDKFDIKEAEKVKEIEKRTNHDVKAVEYYLKEKVPKDLREFVHYGLTSEDINNISYSLLIKEFLENYYYVSLSTLIKTLKVLSQENKSVAMLARTHGQPASPTTLGKELYVFAARLVNEYSKLQNIKLRAKLNGATGNYNALHFAEPEKDWTKFSISFISRLGLEPSLITTQVEPKDSLVELFQCVKRINNIIMDMDRDIWQYVSMEYLVLKKAESEVGSSTMPHKINPIDFENSEGNIRVANSLFTGFEELQISRMQRDLSDSTVMRNIGVAFSHSVLACISAQKGLLKISPNLQKIEKDLELHPEVLTEAVQTLLRKLGKGNAYEKLKEMSRGKKITLDELRGFINGLDIPQKEKEILLNLKPGAYIGLAQELVNYSF